MSFNTIISLIASQVGNEKVSKSNSVRKIALARLDGFKRSVPLQNLTVKSAFGVYMVSMFLMIGGLLALDFAILLVYPEIQTWFMDPVALRFANNGQFLLMIIWAFILPFLLSLLVYALAYLFPNLRLRYFTSSLQTEFQYFSIKKSLEELAENYDIDLYARFLLKRFGSISIALFLLTLPLQTMAIFSATEISDSGVDVTPVLGFSAKHYDWSEIQSVHLSVEKDEDNLDPQLKINFSNGKDVDLWETAIPGTPVEDLLAAMDLLSEHTMIVKSPLPNLSQLRKGLQEKIETIFSH